MRLQPNLWPDNTKLGSDEDYKDILVDRVRYGEVRSTKGQKSFVQQRADDLCGDRIQRQTRWNWQDRRRIPVNKGKREQ